MRKSLLALEVLSIDANSSGSVLMTVNFEFRMFWHDRISVGRYYTDINFTDGVLVKRVSRQPRQVNKKVNKRLKPP